MKASAVIFLAVIFSPGMVYSISDLNDPIVYIDKNQSYFIAIKSGLYRMGIPLNAIQDPNEDMLQFSGKVENCSSGKFECRSIAYLKFAIPKKWVHSSTYDFGMKIVLEQRANGGFYASAVCPKLAPSGCVSRDDGGGPVVTYQYEVNKTDVLTAIRIQYWNDSQIQIGHQDLVLVSGRSGLSLKGKGDGG